MAERFSTEWRCLECPRASKLLDLIPATGNLSTFRAMHQRRSALPSATVVGELEVDPNNPGTIYLAASDGVYKTEDDGANWANIGLDWINDLALFPSEPGLLYAGVNSHSSQYGL